MKHALFVLLLLAGPLWGQDLKFSGEGVKVVTLAGKLPVTVEAMPGALVYVWRFPATVTAEDDLSQTLVITGAPKGELKILVRAIFYDEATKRPIHKTQTGIVIIGDVPQPVPPDPPKPPTPPLPPAPVGFRAIIVHESGDDSKLPAGQFSAMTSKKVTDYLNSKCIGGKEGWRKWDPDQDPKDEQVIWQNLWKTAKPTVGKLPAIIITVNEQVVVDPDTGKAFVVPMTPEAMLALLTKYGG